LTVRQALLGTAAVLVMSASSVAVAQSKALPTDIAAAAVTDIAFATLAFRTTWRGFAEFLGNPNARFTGIDVSAGIDVVNDALDRYTPSFVHCTALDVTATGEYVDTDETTLTALSAYLNPYEDLEYRWSVSVLSGSLTTETMTSPTDGATVNLFEDQVGAEALFVFRNAGTYRITLTVRGRNASGNGYVTETTFEDIVVSDFSDLAKPEFWFDSRASAVGANGTQSNPWTTAADIKAVFINPTYHSGVILNLAQGSTFTITNSGAWSAGGDDGLSPYRIRDYVGGSGAGAKPIIQKDYTAGTNTGEFLISNWSSGTVGGNVISNISFISTNCDETVSLWAASAAGNNSTLKHYYWDNCDFYVEGAGVGSGIEPTIVGIYTNGSNRGLGQQGIGFYKCNLTVDGGQVGMGIQSVVWAGWSVVGCTFNALNGAQVSQANTEHWIYPHVRSRSLYRWTTFQAIKGGFCINGNWDTSGVQDPDQESFYIGDCLFDGTTGNSGSCTIDIGQGADGTGDNSGPDTHYLHVVTERNAFHGFTHGNPFQEADGECVLSHTLRDNRAWDNVNLKTMSSFSCVYKIYRNYMYVPVGSTSQGQIGFADALTFRPHIVTDNIIVHDKDPGTSLNAGFSFMSIPSSAFITQGAFIDRNQYFAREIGFVLDAFHRAGGRDTTFAEWQAVWDVNGIMNEDPLWTYPTDTWAKFDAVNPITVLRVTNANKDAYRTAIISEVFSGDGLPATGSDTITTGITNPLTALGITTTNHASTDYHELEILDENDDLYGTTEFWVFHPTSGNNKLVVLLLGHNPLGISVNTGNMAKDLIAAGYAVALGQPGPNKDETGATGYNSVEDHENLPDRTPTWNALRYFVQGPVRILNQLTGYDAYYSVGQSGGGWLQPLWGAIDTRVTRLCPHAGLMPLYISQDRDWEQNLPGLADLASPGPVDYTDLLALCAYPSRRVLLSINDQDPTGASEFAYLSGPDFVPAVSAFATSQGGSFAFEIDTNTAHSYLSSRRAAIVAFLDAA
jgi:hypothetical protein